MTHSASDFLKGSHDFKFGVQTAYATQRTVSIRFSNVSYTDLNAAPYLATFQDPLASGGRIRSAGGYLQDNWTLNDRITLNLGVRYDHIMGDIPELSAGATLDGISGDASFEVPNSITYPAVEDLISLNTWSPRLGITVRADNSGKTVVKANYGRFYGKLATSMFNSMSPGATPTTTLRYNTATRAYDIPFSFVDNRINFSVNPDLRNQYTDQLFVGLERQLFANMGVNLSFVWKEESDFIRLQDVRGTYAQRAIVDTFEGRTFPLNVFNLTSTQAQRLFQVVNRTDFDQSFKSVVFELNKRFSDSWQSQGSYTWQDSQAYGGGAVTGSTQQDFSSLSSTGGFGRDPNDLDQRLRADGDQLDARGEAVDHLPRADRLQLRHALLLRIGTPVRPADHRPRPRPGERHDAGGRARVVCAAGGQRLPDPRRQGFQHHQQPAAPPVGGLLQHLQLGHDADAPQQQLAGHGDDAVGADAVDRPARGRCSSACVTSSNHALQNRIM